MKKNNTSEQDQQAAASLDNELNSQQINQPAEVPLDEQELALQNALAQIAELTNDLQRTRADFENFRKQVDAQKSQAMTVAKNATIMKFLPLIDDLSRAISAYPEQLQPLEKSFFKTLQSLGLQIITSDPGTEFNPDFHDAASIDDDEGEIEVITETLRPGYMYDGAVVRAAMVRVGHADKSKKS